MKSLQLIVAAALITPALQAQTPNYKSQLSTVTQMVMNTRVEIVYRRPVARGRDLFGSLVPFDKVWSPSADTAAKLTVSTPFEINGSALPAGTYSIWSIPGVTKWEMIFSKQGTAFHMRYPGEAMDALRLPVTPGKGEHVETLEFSFPMVDADSATLQLKWGSVVVPMKIKAKQ